MREAGVEPARPCEHWHLKPASLPIPPLVQVAVSLSDESYISTVLSICQHFFSLVFEVFFEGILGQNPAKLPPSARTYFFFLTKVFFSPIIIKLIFADVLELVDWPA